MPLLMERLRYVFCWHRWSVSADAKVAFGTVRTCPKCGRSQTLEPDYSGYSSGTWVPSESSVLSERER